MCCHGKNCGGKSWSIACTLRLSTCQFKRLTHDSSSSAYSDPLSYLLVWNLLDMIEVYQLTDNHICHLLLIKTLHVRIRRNRICDMQFDCTGKSAISGSDNGEVHLWDINCGQLKQVLLHGKGKQCWHNLHFHH